MAQQTSERRAALIQQVIMGSVAGIGVTELGALFNLHPTTIHRICKSPEGQRMHADLLDIRIKAFHEKALDRLHEVQSDMVEELIGIARQGESERVRLSAITDILDRAGTKVVAEKVELDRPFIQVNIANMDSRHTEGLMPTTLVEALASDEATYLELDADGEEVTPNGSQSSGSEQGQQDPNWSDAEQAREGRGDAEQRAEPGEGMGEDGTERTARGEGMSGGEGVDVGGVTEESSFAQIISEEVE